MTNIFYTQTDITKSNSSQLVESNLDGLLKEISSVNMDITISRMRNVKSISPDSYNHIKRKLPYFLGAKFIDNIRNSKNFEHITHFVIDIDHYGDSVEVEGLKAKLSTDKRLLLSFVSPSGDGLKLVYALTNKITSLKAYSNFYKSFSQKLAIQYNIEKYVDFKTSDATRICFLSYDSNAYVNRENELVDADLFISDFDLFNKPENINSDECKEAEADVKPKINNAQYKDILSRLNPKPPKKQKQYIVPEVLYTVSETIKKELEINGFVVEFINDINYGRKFKIVDKNAFAVFNLYYGRNGFTVVKSPIRNSNEQLLEVIVAICEHVIYTKQEYNLTPNNLSNEQKEERQSYKNDRSDEENKKGRVIQFRAVGS